MSVLDITAHVMLLLLTAVVLARVATARHGARRDRTDERVEPGR